MAVSCASDIKNLGVSQCKKIPKLLKGIIKTAENYTITAALAASSTQWQTDIKADVNNRVYLFPQWAKSFEDVSSEQLLEETPLGVMDANPGQHRWKLGFTENLELHKNMYSHRNTEGRVFLIDVENKIIGTSEDEGTTLKGFLLDNLLTEKLKLSDGSVSTKTLVGVYLADNTELDSRGYMVDASFVNTLVSLTSVDITVASVPAPTATSVTVSIASALDSVPIIGLVQADFNFLKADGSSQNGAISGVTEPDADGTYVIAGAAFVTGTINLALPSALTLDAYESSGSQTVTI
jgi:hypothetical protein